MAGKSSEFLNMVIIDGTDKLDEFDSGVHFTFVIVDESLACSWNSFAVCNNFVSEKMGDDLLLGTSIEINIKLKLRDSWCSV